MADVAYLKALAKALGAKPGTDQEYRSWVLANNVPESNDYDMRGFFNGLTAMDPAAASSVNPNDGRMHFPDKWKLPNHQTFSTDSQYYDARTMPGTPTWQGGAIPGGGESWSLRRPNGSVVAAEAPWYAKGVYKK